MIYPWPVLERSDLVSKDLLDQLNSRANQWLSTRKFHQLVHRQSVEDIPAYQDYKALVLSSLKEFASLLPTDRYSPKQNYELKSSLIVASPWYRQIRHLDSIIKAFSLVTYCNDNNQGTKIHSSKWGGDTAIVPWQAGKTIVFAPNDRSWHSWSSNYNWRVTLISFVVYSSS